jgi:two-component system phosphate regulon response regulator OmpR
MSEPQAHLLVADDDERIRGLLQKFLIRNGFLVTTARDAAQARRLLLGLEFDMLILDVMMPGEDGISLTRDLRGQMSVPILIFWWAAVVQMYRAKATDARRSRYSLLSV